MDEVKMMVVLCIGLSAVGCADVESQTPDGVAVSDRAGESGVAGYTLQQDDAKDVLQQYDANGVLLGTLEAHRATGATTQTWTDRDRDVWQVSSSTGCLSRNGACLGNTEAAVRTSGIALPERELELQLSRAVAAKTDLNGHLLGSAARNPFEVPSSRSTGASLIAECVTVIDILCSTATYCWAMGGDSNCGWVTTTCCFSQH